MSGEAVTLVSSTDIAAATAATAGTTLTGIDPYRKGNFAMNVSSGTGTFTLDARIQTYINGYWTDIAAFTQMSANGTQILHDVGGEIGTGATTLAEAIQDAAITAGNVRAGPLGPQIRAKYTTTGSGTFTFTIVGYVSS